MDYTYGARVQVKFRGATNAKLGTVELPDRLDGLVSVRMDNGEVWTVGKEELLPPDAPLPTYAPFGIEEESEP